jgi:uncharacterized membrane protein
MSSGSAPGERGAVAGVRLIVGLLVLIAWQVAAHWVLTRAGDSALAPWAVLLPVALVALWAGMRGAAAGWGMLILLTALAALAHGFPPLRRALPLLPQLAICLTIAWLFGGTLRRGREPLVTRLSRSVHGTLPPAIAAYTRGVTLAWTSFMLAMAAVSLLLFALAPLAVWSTFANLALLPLTLLMFAAEYAYRKLRYPWFAHATIAQSAGAFLRVSGAARPDAGTR